jgi:hypothetical protein
MVGHPLITSDFDLRVFGEVAMETLSPKAMVRLFGKAELTIVNGKANMKKGTISDVVETIFSGHEGIHINNRAK